MPPVAPTLAVTVEPELARVRLEVTGSAGWTAVSIYRESPSGIEITIRGATETPGLPPLFATADYEPPISVDLTYTATVFDAGGAESPRSGASTVRWDSETEWLRDLTEPALSTPIYTMGETILDYPVSQTALVILNRRAPVVVSDIRRAPVHALTLLTVDESGRERVRRIVATGLPVLWQTSPDKGLGNVYLALEKVNERRGSPLGAEPLRAWDLEGPEVEIPSSASMPLVGGVSTYDAILETNATYSAVLAEFATYLEVRETPAYPGLAPLPPGTEIRDRPPLVWRGE